jgi:hypothetical protein
MFRNISWSGQILAAFFAGVAGTLFVTVEGSVFPDLMFWTLSLEILIMCLLGGWFIFLGPALGAAIIISLRTFVGIYTEYWTLILGVVLMLLIFFLPEGVLGPVSQKDRSGRKKEGRCSMSNPLKNPLMDSWQSTAPRSRSKAGDVVAVIGPNGAGKTTLFHLITGQLAPTAGRSEFKDEISPAWPLHRVCRKGISRSYQVVNIFHRLTVFENVQVAVLSLPQKNLQYFQAGQNHGCRRNPKILDSVGLLDKADMTSGASVPRRSESA